MDLACVRLGPSPPLSPGLPAACCPQALQQPDDLRTGQVSASVCTRAQARFWRIWAPGHTHCKYQQTPDALTWGRPLAPRLPPAGAALWAGRHTRESGELGAKSSAAPSPRRPSRQGPQQGRPLRKRTREILAPGLGCSQVYFSRTIIYAYLYFIFKELGSQIISWRWKNRSC